jgi:hypothetical protein
MGETPLNHEPERKFVFFMTKEHLGLLIPVLAICAGLFGFQNCGQFSVSSDLASQTLIFNSSGGAELKPETDRLDSNCLVKSEYDACLFVKNPVAQRQQAFSGAIQSADIDAIQIYGVKLTSLSSSGLLENHTIRIESASSPAATPSPARASNLKTAAGSDSTGRISQTMAYYWMTRAMEYIEARTGVWPAKGKAIRVITDDTIAGWSPRSNSIHLKAPDSGLPMAWSGELAVHFLGLASLHHATGGAIAEHSSLTHRDCGLRAGGCCSSPDGCSRAIASGVGDYFALMIFPDQPTLGETWANRAEGLGFCNLTRKMSDARTRTAQEAHAACNSMGGAGEVSTMGTIYASIWWEARASASTLSMSGASDIDTLFMRHLAELRGTDTFSSALGKILEIEQSLYKGRYKSLFTQQFQARGL